MPRDKQGMKATRAERNRAFQEGLRRRKRARAANRAELEAKGISTSPIATVIAKHGSKITILPGTVEACGGPHPAPAHVDEVELMQTPLPREMPRGEAERPMAIPPFRAPDVKDDRGWQVVDATGAIAEHATSRDKARRRVRELNAKT